METTGRKRVLFPLLALLFTIVAFALVLFCAFLGSSPFVRLVQGTAPFSSLPLWFRYCLLHPAPFQTLANLGFGFSVLGSTLTLFLLLKIEPSETAFKHLAGIGWAVLITTALFLGLAFVPIFIQLVFIQHSFGVWGGASFNGLLIDLGKAILGIGALAFIVATLTTSLIKIWGRSKKTAPARPGRSVLQ